MTDMGDFDRMVCKPCAARHQAHITELETELGQYMIKAKQAQEAADGAEEHWRDMVILARQVRDRADARVDQLECFLKHLISGGPSPFDDLCEQAKALMAPGMSHMTSEEQGND